MRIVIDMQGTQSASCNRGIGRYTRSLVQGIIRQRGEHEVLLLLNGMFLETLEPIRTMFQSLLPAENIRVWDASAPVDYMTKDNDFRRQSAELIREACIARLKPDILLITSLFDGWSDDAVSTIGALSNSVPTAVILYDLIPLVYRDIYLVNKKLEEWYEVKLEQLGRADLLLGISEATRQEGLNYLGFQENEIVNVSASVDEKFKVVCIDEKQESEVRQRYNIHNSFVMYTGGIDHRKNIEGLIHAYSLLPKSLREQHTLVIVCAVQLADESRLKKLAKKYKLGKNEMILTGFVSDEDMLSLYNLCKVFVFPSWHEGFGLPALEAMSCGKAVIGSNIPILLEVIGRKDGLFDPKDATSISEKLSHVLCDDKFRIALEQHGIERAKQFSWDNSAIKAITAFEHFHENNNKKQAISTLPTKRPKLAYLSPLPPARTGISDYSAELLPTLSAYYEIDIITAQEEISDPWVNANCTIQTVDWFRDHAKHYERVLYHFGNSEFHSHMFNLLEEIPGVVILHDFFLSGIIAYLDVNNVTPDNWAKELYKAHGYHAVRERYYATDTGDVIWKYPCNISVVSNALGMIVHSKNSRQLAKKWHDSFDDNHWEVVPLTRAFVPKVNRNIAREVLGIKPEEFVICSFGMIAASKLNHRLITAWLNSSLMNEKQCVLIFVGENNTDAYGQSILTTIRKNGVKSRVRITNWTDAETYRNYLSAVDMAVQLRTRSRGETSAAVLDCMNYGLPTIVNANGSMAELSDAAVWKLADDFSDNDLIEALETLRNDSLRREKIGSEARNIIMHEHTPRGCAKLYFNAIENFYNQSKADIHSAIRQIIKLDSIPKESAIWTSLATSLDKSVPSRITPRQLFVDVSEIVRRDSKSGIQRVLRAVLKEWLMNPPEGFRVEPVYATTGESYRYARQFTLEFLGDPTNAFNDDIIEYHTGDIFLGLDLSIEIVPVHQDFFQELRNQGVYVKFIIYDLLCLLKPQHFIKDAGNEFDDWLKVVAANDGAVCISKSVANEFRHWLDEYGIERQRPLTINHFYLGTDKETPMLFENLAENEKVLLRNLGKRPTFLMVGTIEPRKGYGQTLKAIEQLWPEDRDINLVIVGKQGWMIDELIEKTHGHNEFNKRLFWLKGISNEYLEEIYAVSSCLIAASEGEGFGLPLIEAAKHKLPIIARDIPLFNEIAGDHAFYSSGLEDNDLAEAMKTWLTLFEAKEHPESEKIECLTWSESVSQLLKAIV